MNATSNDLNVCSSCCFHSRSYRQSYRHRHCVEIGISVGRCCRRTDAAHVVLTAKARDACTEIEKALAEMRAELYCQIDPAAHAGCVNVMEQIKPPRRRHEAATAHAAGHGIPAYQKVYVTATP